MSMGTPKQSLKLEAGSFKLERKDAHPAFSFQLDSCTPQGPRGEAQRRRWAFGEAVAG
jgi:hypothetical protein